MVSDKTPHRGDWSTTQQGYKTGSWERRWIRKAWGCHIKGFSQNAVLWLPSLQFKQTWNASRMSGLYSLPVANMAMENLSLGSVVLCHPWCWLQEEPWGWSECRDKKGHFHMWRRMLAGLEQSEQVLWQTAGELPWKHNPAATEPVQATHRELPTKLDLCPSYPLSLPFLQTQTNGGRNADNISKSH